MTRFTALLRGVNVGGHRMVPMADLRTLLDALGMRNVISILQSGNLVFDCSAKSASKVEELLEREMRSQLGLEADVLVRSGEEWSSIVDANPFRGEAKSDPGHLLVMILKQEPPAAAIESLEAAIRGREKVRLAGRALYLVYPDGVGRSRLTSTLIEKTLATRGTARNWNTVLKIERAFH